MELPSARTRPVVHFAPRSGWTNDPHGVVHDGERYHLFFQSNPSTAWVAACEWGHAVSDDLVVWSELPVALRPDGDRGEVGCWSGAVVVQDGLPTIIYTRIAGDDWDRGQVALARGTASYDGWRRDPQEPVIDGPPDGEVTRFRDPFVWRHGDRWHLLMGAGTADGTALALQYGSDDLLAWRYDGAVACRPVTQTEPETGSMWECPQLFALDGTWVLLVSVWHGEPRDRVAYALGDYDGRTFSARAWGSYACGDVLYATSAFVDSAGRRCALSWAREPADAAHGATWAGALSLPHVLRVDGDRLRVAQHPSLDGHRGAPVPAGRGPLRLPACADVEVAVRCPSTGRVRLTFEGERSLVELLLDGPRAQVALTCSGETLATAAYDVQERDRLRLVLDADLLEVTASGMEGVLVGRLPGAASWSVEAAADGDAAVVGVAAWELRAVR